MASLTRIGKFIRLKLLGRGYFGEVYLVKDSKLDQERALKIIGAPSGGDFDGQLAEARTLVTCRHKHVVEVKEADFYSVDGAKRVCIAYELLAKGSVEAQMRTGYQYSPYEATSIIVQALFGLEYLHLKRPTIIHRDIKPGNLLIADNGDIKLSDFGLAVFAPTGAASPVGYTVHLAPEVIAGGGTSSLSDVYAMGITYYRLLNGLAGFSGSVLSDIKKEIVRGRFPDRNKYKSCVPMPIRKICNKAIHVDPSRRFQSAKEFRQALERLSWNIKWTCISPHQWNGQRDSQDFLLHLEKRVKAGWVMTSLKNGRKVIPECVNCGPDELSAIECLQRLAASKTLK